MLNLYASLVIMLFSALSTELRFYAPHETKQIISKTFFPANLLGIEY